MGQALGYIVPGAGSIEGLGERQLNDKLDKSIAQLQPELF
jgi:hypothetical protein